MVYAGSALFGTCSYTDTRREDDFLLVHTVEEVLPLNHQNVKVTLLTMGWEKPIYGSFYILRTASLCSKLLPTPQGATSHSWSILSNSLRGSRDTVYPAESG